METLGIIFSSMIAVVIMVLSICIIVYAIDRHVNDITDDVSENYWNEYWEKSDE